MVTPREAWLLGLAMMLAVFLYMHWRTSDIRYSFMASLAWGKVLAGVYWILGLDYPLLAFYSYREGLGYHPVFTVTANTAILALLFLANITTYAWPEIKRELGLWGEIPGMPLERRGRG